MNQNRVREKAWRFTISKVTARSFLEHCDPRLRDLAERCAKAFLREKPDQNSRADQQKAGTE